MRQQVNLLTHVKKQKDWLNGRLLGGAMLGVVVLLVAYSLFLIDQKSTKENNLVSMELTVAGLEKEIQVLTASIPSVEETQAITDEIDKINDEMNHLNDITELLRSQRLGNSGGFSALLEGFARRIPEGSWLSSFNISDGGVNIQLNGTALSPEIVPIFLQKLAIEKSLAGVEFKSFELFRTKENKSGIHFKIDTREASKSASASGKRAGNRSAQKNVLYDKVKNLKAPLL